jgi:hypothetical protein
MSPRTLAITRAIAVIGGTGALIVAATFAATSNAVTISGISLASSDVQALQVYDFGSTWANHTSNPGDTGAVSADLTTSPGTLEPFYLQNTSGTDLDISATANPAAPDNVGGLNPSNVEVTFWDDSATPVQLGQGTLASMEAGTSVALNTLKAGSKGDSTNVHNGNNGNYYVSFSLVSADSSFDQLNNVQLIFTGTPHS